MVPPAADPDLRTPLVDLPAAGSAQGEDDRSGVRASVLGRWPLEARVPFDRPVPPGGYLWHYLDGVSDDGAWGIVVIALVGNPFSPAYARARAAQGPAASALWFSAMNVAVYSTRFPRRSYWALTERAIREADRAPDQITIGGSSARWDRGDLVVELDERTAPFPSPVPGRIRGRVRLAPEGPSAGTHALDAAGGHLWCPVAPLSAIEVELDEPRVRFRGHGYHDVNHGDGPLDEAFSRWCWSRARTDDGGAILTYDALRRDGTSASVAVSLDGRGARDPIEPLTGTSLHDLHRTRWRIDRRARADEGAPPTVVRDLEDTPFYARALVKSRLGGRDVVAMHEELSADRLRASWVRFLLGFRMGRG